MRDLDEDYDLLMDELESAVAQPDSAEAGRRVREVRLKIGALLREQMGLARRLSPPDRRYGPNALN